MDLEDKEFKLALPKCLQRKGNHVCGIEESMAVMSHQIENSDEETPVVNRLLKTLQWKLGSQTIRSLKSKVINIPHENLLTSCCFASRSTS